MGRLYPNNLGSIEISEEDMNKIGRGMAIGYEYGTVTDLETGISYKVFSASCGLDSGCNCAVTVEPIKQEATV